MKIRVKKIKGQHRVYQGTRLVGELRTFCCGVDFRIKDKPLVLFSILKEKMGTETLLFCVEKLLSLEIPNKQLHFNFSYKTAKNSCMLFAFGVALKNYRK